VLATLLRERRTSSSLTVAPHTPSTFFSQYPPTHSLYPTPYTLHPTPYNLHPTPCSGRPGQKRCGFCIDLLRQARSGHGISHSYKCEKTHSRWVMLSDYAPSEPRTPTLSALEPFSFEPSPLEPLFAEENGTHQGRGFASCILAFGLPRLIDSGLVVWRGLTRKEDGSSRNRPRDVNHRV